MNRRVLLVFGPVLILSGLLGFVLPERYAVMSGAPAYNLFHLAFGSLGLALLWRAEDRLIRAFNLGFGLLDLYQAVASLWHLFPAEQFRWTRADDAAHWVLGLGLVAVALWR